MIGCEKNPDEREDYYSAEIVGFDLNCSTCILSFPEDSLKVRTVLGESPRNYYQTVNLDKDQFVIGQRIEVKVRKAEPTELRACITLFPSYNYENIYVSDYKYSQDFLFNDTINLAYGDCLVDFENQNAICFDSVLTDSRCPEDLMCFWAGEAIARFSINKNQNDEIVLDLLTGTVDTIFADYKFSFIDLLPYPNTQFQNRPENYRAKILLKLN
jgi:hypothetical protein